MLSRIPDEQRIFVRLVHALVVEDGEASKRLAGVLEKDRAIKVADGKETD